jgi:hypothetical protein
MKAQFHARRRALSMSCAVAIAMLATSGSASSAGSGYSLQSHVIASGGVSAAHSACFDLSATIGEPTAGSAAGGTFSMVSGFWAARVARPDSVFRSSFEGCQP